MIQHVKELFQETKTIIIPQLGALTITNPDTGELMFMPYLKHDDGVLAEFIAKKEGIPVEDAKKGIAEKVTQVLDELANGNPIAFGDFGRFAKDADGDIIFENAADIKGSADATVETPAAPPPAEAPPAEDVPEEVPEEETKAPEPEEEPIEEAEPEVAAKTEKPEKQEETSETSTEEVSPTTEEVESTPETDTNAEDDATTLAEEIKAAEEAEKEEEAKRTAEALEATSLHTPEPEPEAPKAPEKTIAEEIKEAEQQPETPKAAETTESDSPKKELNILEKEEIAANQQKLKDLQAKKDAGKKKRKRGAGFYVLLFFLVLIIGGGTYVGLNFEQVKGMLFADNGTPESKGDEEVDKMKEIMGEEPEITPADTMGTSAIDTASTMEPEVAPAPPQVDPTPAPKPEKKPETVQVSGTNNQPYHIVAGVFSSEDNAKRLADKIRGMGYPAKTFPRGGQTVVSVQSYATSSEAQAALSSVQDAAPSGWVLHWPN